MKRKPARYGTALLVLLVGFVLLNALLTKPRGADGIVPGERVPPFAVPLARGTVNGDANIATRAGAGARHAACTVRGPGILNVCELYESSPLVLALFVDAGSCPTVLDRMQALAPAFPRVRFAAVALGGERASLRRLEATHALTLPVGLDREGVLSVLYKVVSCPQLSFVYPGGVVQSRALLETPTQAQLRARVAALVAAAHMRGWRG